MYYTGQNSAAVTPKNKPTISKRPPTSPPQKPVYRYKQQEQRIHHIHYTHWNIHTHIGSRKPAAQRPFQERFSTKHQMTHPLKVENSTTGTQDGAESLHLYLSKKFETKLSTYLRIYLFRSDFFSDFVYLYFQFKQLISSRIFLP